MLLTPQKTEIKGGIKINFFKLTEVDTSKKPSKIEIRCFEQIKNSPYPYFAEFMTRRVIYDDVPPPTFFVDNLEAWKLKDEGEVIQIVICGEKGKDKAIKLIKLICNTYNLGLNQLAIFFNDYDFIQKLKGFLEFKKVEYVLPNIEEPKIALKTFVKGQWQEPILGQPVESISLKVTDGGLKYRVFSRKQWLPWVENGQPTGIKGYPIKGFQVDFKHENYKVIYRCHLLNNKYTNWESTSSQRLYNQIIDSFEFKLEKIQ